MSQLSNFLSDAKIGKQALIVSTDYAVNYHVLLGGITDYLNLRIDNCVYPSNVHKEHYTLYKNKHREVSLISIESFNPFDYDNDALENMLDGKSVIIKKYNDDNIQHILDILKGNGYCIHNVSIR